MSLINIQAQNYKRRELINTVLWNYFFNTTKLYEVIKKQNIYVVGFKIFAIKVLSILLSDTIVYAI